MKESEEDNFMLDEPTLYYCSYQNNKILNRYNDNYTSYIYSF